MAEVIRPQPPHILNRAFLEPADEIYRKKYPNCTILHAETAYRETWKYFSTEMNLHSMPPSMIVDNTTKYQMLRVGTNIGWTNMVLNRYWIPSETIDIDGENVPETLFSSQVEIRVYGRAFVRTLKEYYGRNLTSLIACLEMVHYFFHELFHYYDFMETEYAILHEKDPQKAKDLLVEYWHSECNYNQESGVERKTEERALALFEKWLRGMYEDDFGVILNGSYDQFMYTKHGPENYHYHQCLAMLEVEKLDCQRLYAGLTQEQSYETYQKMQHIIKHDIRPYRPDQPVKCIVTY